MSGELCLGLGPAGTVHTWLQVVCSVPEEIGMSGCSCLASISNLMSHDTLLHAATP